MNIAKMIIREVFNKNSINEKYYRYIQSNSRASIKMLTKALLETAKTIPPKKPYQFNHPTIKILDVGSGTAGKLMQFRGAIDTLKTLNLIRDDINIETHGLEVDPNLACIADYSHLEHQKLTIIEDALKFKKYKDYDIIYYYCPIKDTKLQIRLEKLIERSIKKGAHIIAINKQNCPYSYNKKHQKLPKNIIDQTEKYNIYENYRIGGYNDLILQKI
ncbi:MAG: hypothetical protein Q7R56_01760 [Nanoarchaeota archaeon]|nr:hypothetical protein [Nanoarchaeota archaeon]